MIDIGANLTHASFREDLAEVVARARSAHVESLVVTGTTVEESRRAAKSPSLQPLRHRRRASRTTRASAVRKRFPG